MAPTPSPSRPAALARQADGAVLVSMGDTVVLVTAVGRTKPPPARTFFPLTVNYVEKTYAAGRIPGGFFKREGRPTEKETLTSRLIDRPIRPLFPDGFYNEVQVVATVMSLDPEIDSDIPAMLGASAALCLSGMPFKGPIGAARVGYHDGKYLLNPTAKDLQTSSLDLVVAGTADAVLMVESEAERLSEDVMLGAVVLRPRADAGRDPGDQRARGGGGQAGVAVERTRGRCRARGGGRAPGRGGARQGLRDHREADRVTGASQKSSWRPSPR